MAQTTNDAGFVQLQSSFGEGLFNAASLRYDSNDRLGDVSSYRIASALLIAETGTKLKTSYGTGFKAPSLEQLFVSFPAFNFFANPNLKPEESIGYDAGFEQSIFGHVTFGATYFHNDITNLIDSNGKTFVNITKAETYGVESFIQFRPLAGLALGGHYAYNIANDETLHETLLRRPKHKASLTASWQATETLLLSGTIIYKGAFIDGNRDFSIPRLRASDYAIVNVAGSYMFDRELTAFARIDNLFNEQYQDPTGFLRPGLGVFGGIKVAVDVADALGERK